MISLSLATDMVLLMVTALMYSLAFALVTPALSALVVDVTTTQTRGSAMATYTAAMDVGIGSGAFLWGFVIQQVGFTVMYQLAAVVAVIGIVATSSLSTEKWSRWNLIRRWTAGGRQRLTRWRRELEPRSRPAVAGMWTGGRIRVEIRRAQTRKTGAAFRMLPSVSL